MSRLKLPAYGKRLLDDRRAGKHPLEVTLVYGDDWFTGKPPRVCIKPDDYLPGTVDFSVVAGLRVVVIDEYGVAFDGDSEFFDMLAEIARFAAHVEITWGKDWGFPPEELSDFARSHRVASAQTKRYEWPRWWSDDLDRAYRARFDGWFDDLMATQQSPIEERGRA